MAIEKYNLNFVGKIVRVYSYICIIYCGVLLSFVVGFFDLPMQYFALIFASYIAFTLLIIALFSALIQNLAVIIGNMAMILRKITQGEKK